MSAYQWVINRKILNFDNKSLKWYRRLKYTNEWVSIYRCLSMISIDEIFRKRNKRHVYNVENYILLNKQKTRFAQCFVYIYQRTHYEFIIVNIIEKYFFVKNFNEYLLNSILKLSMYKIFNRQQIYSLFVISHKIIYLIKASKKSNWQLNKNDYLLHCTWNVDYL